MLQEPERCRFPRPYPVDQGGSGKVPLYGQYPCGDIRLLCRRTGSFGRRTFPPGILQGILLQLRLPRQPDGQNLVERTVDGLSGGQQLHRLLQRGKRPPADAPADARGRRNGRQRGSGFHHASGRCPHQSQQGFRVGGPAGRKAQHGRKLRGTQAF